MYVKDSTLFEGKERGERERERWGRGGGCLIPLFGIKS